MVLLLLLMLLSPLLLVLLFPPVLLLLLLVMMALVLLRPGFVAIKVKRNPPRDGLPRSCALPRSQCTRVPNQGAYRSPRPPTSGHKVST